MRKRNQCVFCQGSKMSKEHFWPQWMAKYLKVDGKGHEGGLLEGPFNGVAVRKDWTERPQGDLTTYKLRVVCRKCNNGWMSQVEERVKPLLLSILSGQKISINHSSQEDLAKWITLKVILSEHSHQGKNVTPSNDRRKFYHEGKIPDYFRVYIGRHNTDSKCWSYRHSISLTTSKETISPPLRGLEKNTQTVSFICGDLFIHALAVRVDGINVDEFIDFPKMHQIWPIIESTVDWPFEFAFSRSQLALILDSLTSWTNKQNIKYLDTLPIDLE